ncbi:MAG TPA: radical SAM protein, partial [Anaerolinea sp.]|nr:radical SAM protein [Anaerolinea sp.]
MSRHLLLVPSLACPASCSYCFGPHAAAAPMAAKTVEQTAGWLAQQASPEDLEITFHGGEPLLASAGYYRQALPRLRNAWQGRAVRFSVQSNLWRLDVEHLEVFNGYPVGLGTSLDGPEEINDAQRGKGYFRRTMAGIEKARRRGIPVGCIVTFSAQTAPEWRRVVEFFLSEGLSFSVHAALPVLGRPAGS